MARTPCRCQDPTADGFSDRCARATAPAWDPTRGVQSSDDGRNGRPLRHEFSRTGYGPR